MPVFLTGIWYWWKTIYTADNGDMVVALIDDGATVKTFYKEEGFIKTSTGERLYGSDHRKRLPDSWQGDWCI